MSNPNAGAFVATTNVWDVSEIYALQSTSPELKELLVRLYQNLNKMSLSLNIRDAGFYNTQEFVNGQLFFPNPSNTSLTASTPAFRQVFRKVINFGALPNNTVKSVDTGIIVTPSLRYTRIYGVANNPSTNYALPLPYVTRSTAATEGIQVRLQTTGGSPNTTQLRIRTEIDYTAYTDVYVVLEYIKT